jgi:hypothetical protein
MPSKARPDGCTGNGCFALEFTRTLHEYLQDACDKSHDFVCTLSEYMKILNLRTDHPVKSQPLHKVFLFIQNVAN